MNRSRIATAARGVVSTTLTPFRDDLEIDVDALRRNVEHVVEVSDVVVPAGNTAEHSSLTPREVRLVARETLQVVQGRAVVVVGIGGPLPVALELARDLQSMGADGIMIHQPAHAHTSPEGVRAYIEAICDAAPEVAVFPYKRSHAIVPDTVLEAVLERPNLLGVKYAAPDVRALKSVLLRTTARHPDVAWINGLAETWAPAFHAAGAPGFTSGLVNVHPELSARMRDALAGGGSDRIDEVFAEVEEFEYLRAAYDGSYNVPVVKEAAHQLGLCARTVRPPLSPVRDADRKRIADILRGWGLT